MKTKHSKSSRRSPSPAQPRDEPAVFKNILVPIDFSETSLKALRYAVPLAEQHGATLHLLYVIEPPRFTGDSESFPLVIPPVEESARCKDKLFALANDEIEELVPVTAGVCVGKPATEICDIALKSEADIIVIATHGRTGLSRMLLGSTAEAVIRHAPCPVLVVPGHEREVVSLNQGAFHAE